MPAKFITQMFTYVERYIAIFWKKWAKKNQFLAYSVCKIDDVTPSLQ